MSVNQCGNSVLLNRCTDVCSRCTDICSTIVLYLISWINKKVTHTNNKKQIFGIHNIFILTIHRWSFFAIMSSGCWRWSLWPSPVTPHLTEPAWSAWMLQCTPPAAAQPPPWPPSRSTWVPWALMIPPRPLCWVWGEPPLLAEEPLAPGPLLDWWWRIRWRSLRRCTPSSFTLATSRSTSWSVTMSTRPLRWEGTLGFVACSDFMGLGGFRFFWAGWHSQMRLSPSLILKGTVASERSPKCVVVFLTRFDPVLFKF